MFLNSARLLRVFLISRQLPLIVASTVLIHLVSPCPLIGQFAPANVRNLSRCPTFSTTHLWRRWAWPYRSGRGSRGRGVTTAQSGSSASCWRPGALPPPPPAHTCTCPAAASARCCRTAAGRLWRTGVSRWSVTSCRTASRSSGVLRACQLVTGKVTPAG